MDGGQSTLWRELVATNSAQPQSSNCTHIYPVYDRRFVATLTAAVVITSLLSVFGSALIIFTYAAFKNLRTIAREILVQLSVADIIVAVSHIVGITANLPRFIPKKPCEQQTDPASAFGGRHSLQGTGWRNAIWNNIVVFVDHCRGCVPADYHRVRKAEVCKMASLHLLPHLLGNPVESGDLVRS